MESNSIVGTWELLSWQHEEPNRADGFPRGDAKGRITYGADGQMAVVIASTSRPKVRLARLLALLTRGRDRGERLAIGYSGGYEVLGGEVVHHVVVSTVPAYASQDLVRRFSVRDDKLHLSYMGPAGKGVMTWRRIGKG